VFFALHSALPPELLLLQDAAHKSPLANFCSFAPSLFPLLFVQLREAGDALQQVRLGLALSLSFSQLLLVFLNSP